VYLLSIHLYGGEVELNQVNKKCPELVEYIKFNSSNITKMDVKDAPFEWLVKKVKQLDKDVIITTCKTDSPQTDVIATNNGKWNIIVGIEKSARKQDVHSLAWSRLVFKMLFISHFKSAVETRSKNGEINENEMFDAVCQANFASTKEIKEFFNETWRPWAIANGAVPIHSRAWFLYADTSDYRSWMEQQEKEGNTKLWKKWALAQRASKKH
jgi:hypothetical protein